MVHVSAPKLLSLQQSGTNSAVDMLLKPLRLLLRQAAYSLSPPHVIFPDQKHCCNRAPGSSRVCIDHAAVVSAWDCKTACIVAHIKSLVLGKRMSLVRLILLAVTNY